MNLKTIAEKAGVSTATVSNVINGNHHKVSQKTLLKVQKIIEENNYQPNATARSLASKESKIIGVVIPHVSLDENLLSNPHDARILALLENYIRKQGYYLMVRCVEKCEEIEPLFSTWNVDGVIIFGTFKKDVEEMQGRLDVPIVYIDTYAEGIKIANVGIDDYKGGYLAARYLLGKGHKEIAFVGPDFERPGVIRQRYKGFCDACAERGIELTQDHIFQTDTIYRSGVSVGQKIAISDIKFTAVAAMSDIVAFGIMEGLRVCGLNVPNDISVIGFDNLTECRYSYPKMTSVAPKVEEQARLVGEYLFKMIHDKKQMVINEKLDVEIVERQSVRDISAGME